MTRDEVIKLILVRCGRREKDTVLQEACVTEMRMVQEMVLEQAYFKPWFLLSEYMHASTGIDEQRIPVPTKFLEEHEEGTLWVKPMGSLIWEKLEREDVDKLEEEWTNQVGPPQEYAVVKNYFVLFPTPDLQYPLKMRCYLKEPVLTYAYGTEANETVTTNNWLTHAADWIMGEVGARIAGSYLRDPALKQEFQDEATKARDRLYVQHVAREEMNRLRNHGDD